MPLVRLSLWNRVSSPTGNRRLIKSKILGRKSCDFLPTAFHDWVKLGTNRIPDFPLTQSVTLVHPYKTNFIWCSSVWSSRNRGFCKVFLWYPSHLPCELHHTFDFPRVSVWLSQLVTLPALNSGNSDITFAYHETDRIASISPCDTRHTFGGAAPWELPERLLRALV